jgi:8-oxo-dGTP pyrophosphatase MutT (NUDIX family)
LSSVESAVAWSFTINLNRIMNTHSRAPTGSPELPQVGTVFAEGTLMQIDTLHKDYFVAIGRAVVHGSNGHAPFEGLLIKRRPSAILIPVTHEGKIVMIKHDRFGSDVKMLEFPGGVIDDGKEPEEIAVEETSDETGYTVRRPILTQLDVLREGSAHTDKSVYVFSAPVDQTEAEPEDGIETIELTVEEASSLLNEPARTDMDTTTRSALLLYLNSLEH